MTTRRGWRSDAIYFDHTGDCTDSERHRHCPGRWRGVISLGYGPDGRRMRRKVSGQTKTIVVQRLKDQHDELDDGIKPTPANYAVRKACEDWLAHGLTGLSAKTVAKNEAMLAPLLAMTGTTRLRELTAADVGNALAAMARSYSSASVSIGHLALKRAIRQAQAADLVSRNVAELVITPKGRPGRPSKSLDLAQAVALLAAADGTRIGAYIALCMATGIRTEEARALQWEHVRLGDPDADPPQTASVEVWRSVRSHGDTKTDKSRRTLRLPQVAADALSALAAREGRAEGLVFATRTGKELLAGNVRREFRAACKAAGIGPDWTPRELRHSFVSLMSAQGVPVEEIARLAGHKSSRVTEVVYRRELRPELTAGAEAMDALLGRSPAEPVQQRSA
jgi:integrase